MSVKNFVVEKIRKIMWGGMSMVLVPIGARGDIVAVCWLVYARNAVFWQIGNCGKVAALGRDWKSTFGSTWKVVGWAISVSIHCSRKRFVGGFGGVQLL